MTDIHFQHTDSGQAPVPVGQSYHALLTPLFWRLLACLLLSFLVICTAWSVRAEVPQERNIKAAFIAKFIGYIDFPVAEAGSAEMHLVIGVLGADDVAADLTRQVTGRSINGRTVTVKTIAPREKLDGLHILFIGVAESDSAEKPLRNAAALGILSITEFDSGMRLGSVINFRMVDDRVRFEVSLPAAEKAGLKLSSRLLSVAYLVQKAAP
ncbi:YfiR family protein [Undibacterium sp. TC4M20W]|uniref:YfiR family protein n=1 Tax=Undibacterium sp. TC4M20W TaxID=3413052 RepID=UPI003BF304A0